MMGYLQQKKRLEVFITMKMSHSLNVSLMSIIIAKWMNLSEAEIDEIASAGLLHDIGKMKISEKLLLKPGKLSDLEFEELKKHPVFGYPVGAFDEEIPLFPKIVAIADIYDAMTSNTAYRNRMCPFEVIKNFEMQTFGKLDTRILTVFIKNIANTYMWNFVELNSGEICEIVFINPNRVWQPIVRFGDEFIDLSHDSDKRFIKAIV
ncbi:MAG: HD-GYP domain-containing protein [Clostridia bacterium]